ncbi:uncharacterized protein MYCFIDRAFT_79369 [Pseudocercospora fijiensis CIRAD86]|uniref:BTB domain-containing protein n=1 Tax=Pseudocercospora fijiensis (strain CIRAD86) TaxID=383855 RepID=M3AL18_PSEFD|nr:uncharacterized protein MYCFIDRAFT_79369 [Pseudocercospora fijiensis CIRAD86]EME78152.1 hypothetical protein MYCFIDRAFT_79369 [Pseudocercospora fijiensis CIRAD86]
MADDSDYKLNSEAELDSEDEFDSDDELDSELTDVITIHVEHTEDDGVSSHKIQHKYLEKSHYFRDRLARASTYTSINLSGAVHTVSLPEYLHFLKTDELPEVWPEEIAMHYLYGERVGDVRFKNLVVARMAQLLEGLVPTKCARKIYRHTSEGSLARRLLVDHVVYRGRASWLEDFDCPDELVKDVAIEAMKARDIHSMKEFRVENYLEPESRAMAVRE